MRVHFIGVGGASMSALAAITAGLGHEVSGSDVNQTTTLKNIQFFKGHSAANVGGAELVVYTAAIGENNPELRRARELGLRIEERAEYLARIEQGFERSVAISGTHGKTTTTAMLAECLPFSSAHIGGIYPPFGSGYRLCGKGVFITEACEYKKSFAKLNPFIGIILNSEMDHPDYFANENEVTAAFAEFAHKVNPQGAIVIGKDNLRLLSALEGIKTRIQTFSVDQDADVCAKNVEQARGIYSYDLWANAQKICRVQLSVEGRFNVVNSLAASAAALMLGASAQDISAGLLRFKGVHRRFEKMGKLCGAQIINDYAHHPTELTQALLTAKKLGKRVIAVFQPHTYSRTQALFDDFVQALKIADIAAVYRTFGARERDARDLIGVKLANAVPVQYLTDFKQVEQFLQSHAQEDDVILLLGAGDLFKIDLK